jgi:hypothetical protein
MTHNRRLLRTIARFPNRPRAGVVMGAVAGLAVLLAPASDGRSIGALLAVAGVTGMLHGWGILTNWAGVWDQHQARERRRVARAREAPLSRTGIGRLVIELNRRDHPSFQAFTGMGTMVAGPALTVCGILIAIGVIRL